MAKRIIVEVVAILLILLWVYSSLSKLLDYEIFRFQLGRSPYTTNLAGVLAWALPFSELFIALLLVYKRSRLWGLSLSLFLMAIFTGYVYSMLHFSSYIPCSCGGILSSMSWHQHLYFNALMTILAGIGTVSAAQRVSK